MSRIYRLLRSDPSDLDFFDKMKAALDHVYQKHGVAFEYSYSDTDAGLASHVYMEKTKRAVLTIVEDHQTVMRYLMMEVGADNLATQLEPWLAAELPFIPLEELRDQAHRNLEKDPKSLVRLAIGSGETTDPTGFQIIAKALRHSDPKVRLAAVEAASVSQWREFQPELQSMKARETDPEVREMIDATLN